MSILSGCESCPKHLPHTRYDHEICPLRLLLRLIFDIESVLRAGITPLRVNYSFYILGYVWWSFIEDFASKFIRNIGLWFSFSVLSLVALPGWVIKRVGKGSILFLEEIVWSWCIRF